MVTRVIICALSPFRRGATSCSYHGDDGVEYQGTLSSEAPISYLMARAKKEWPYVNVGRVIYLCSSICKEVSDEIPTTPEEHFLSHLRSFANQAGADAPTCRRIRYEPDSDSRETLRLLLNEINDANEGEGVIVDIDATGGPRDVMTLVALSVQVIKIEGPQGATLGRITYSSDITKRIVCQNGTYDIVDLVNAVDSFMRHGRAAPLSDFFRARHDECSTELLDAVESMLLFSDALALCRAGDAYAELPRIRARLEALAEESDADMSNVERLFRALVPTMRQGIFASGASDGNLGIAEVIRWCVERGMLQQALALFEEKVPAYLSALGILPCVPERSSDAIGALLQLGAFNGIPVGT